MGRYNSACDMWWNLMLFSDEFLWPYLVSSLIGSARGPSPMIYDNTKKLSLISLFYDTILIRHNFFVINVHISTSEYKSLSLRLPSSLAFVEAHQTSSRVTLWCLVSHQTRQMDHRIFFLDNTNSKQTRTSWSAIKKWCSRVSSTLPWHNT
jgi:hypothetical protein